MEVHLKGKLSLNIWRRKCEDACSICSHMGALEEQATLNHALFFALLTDSNINAFYVFYGVLSRVLFVFFNVQKMFAC